MFIIFDVLIFGILLLVLVSDAPASFLSDKFISPKDLKSQYESAAIKMASNCKGTSGKEPCYIKEFNSVTREKGFTFAENTLYALQNFDPALRHCHVISHEISKIATRANPSLWQDLIASVNVDTCGGGFLHGILEAHIGDDPDFTINDQTVPEICGNDYRVHKDRSCTHLLGHLILVQEEGDVEKGAAVCSQINDANLSEECYTGVFMEDSFKTSLFDHGLAELPVRDEARMIRQTQRCLKYTGVAGNGCWIDLAEIYNEFYNYDPLKVYESCYKAPAGQMGQKCYLKAAILMAVSPNYDNVENMVGICEVYDGQPALYQKCNYFALSALTHYSIKFTSRGVKLCSNIAESDRRSCFEELGRQLKALTPDIKEREDACAGTSERYMYLCVAG